MLLIMLALHGVELTICLKYACRIHASADAVCCMESIYKKGSLMEMEHDDIYCKQGSEKCFSIRQWAVQYSELVNTYRVCDTLFSANEKVARNLALF